MIDDRCISEAGADPQGLHRQRSPAAAVAGVSPVSWTCPTPPTHPVDVALAQKKAIAADIPDPYTSASVSSDNL